MSLTRTKALGKFNSARDAENASSFDHGVAPACNKSMIKVGGIVTSLAMVAALVYAFCNDNTYFGDEAAKTPDSTVGHTAHRLKKNLGDQLADNVFFLLSIAALSFSVYMSATIAFPLVIVFLRRRIRNSCCKTFEQLVAAGMPCKDITAIIPCFLPNEQDIIEDTINHVMNKVESPAAMRTIVVYNTPNDMPEIEERLQDMTKRTDYRDARTLEVIRVRTSKSKADNLNHVIPRISTDYFVIYDADHNPDSDSLIRMYREMWEQDADIVQGSTYIRNLSHSLLARLVDAEFFVLYFCIFMASQLWTRLGIFGGSNALVRKEALGDKLFSHSMQTEDVDLTIRMILSGKKIVFCPEARSGELVPPSFQALYKQRLRWAIGWDQVSFKYFNQVVSNKILSVWQKYCLIHWLYLRWGGPICLVVLPVLHFVYIDKSGKGASNPYMQALASMILYGMFFVPIFGVIEAILQAGHRGLESVKQVFMVLVYYVAAIPVMLWQGFLVVVSMRRIFTGNAGGWVVTSRSAPDLQALVADADRSNKLTKGDPRSLSAPLLSA